MPYDEDQIANLEADVDDLVTPTTEDVLAFSQDYDAGIVAASALQKSLNGGGGGGSFNGGTITEPLIIENSLAVTGGIFTQLAPEGNNGVFFDVGSWDGNNELTIAQSLAGAGRLEYWDGGDVVFEIGPGGAVTISPSDDALDYSLTVSSLQDGGAALMVPWYADLGLGNDAHKFDNYGTWYGQSALLLGQVGDAAASVLLTLQSSVDTTAFITATDGSNEMFVVGPTGAVTISPIDFSTALTIQLQPDPGDDDPAAIVVNDGGAVTRFIVDSDGFWTLRQNETRDAIGEIRNDAGNVARFTEQLCLRLFPGPDAGDNLLVTGAANTEPTNLLSVVPSFTSSVFRVVDEGDESTTSVAISATNLGFYGATPVAQQTVAVGINEIHAALVNLGLIVEAP